MMSPNSTMLSTIPMVTVSMWTTPFFAEERAYAMPELDTAFMRPAPSRLA